MIRSEPVWRKPPLKNMLPVMDDVFSALRAVMVPYTKQLDVKHDEPGNFHVDTFHIMKNDKPLFFGAVQIKKNYVSYHLMPVYVNPGLLDTVSPALRKRMQGKSCFNFKSMDAELFEELARFTALGAQDYRERGYSKSD